MPETPAIPKPGEWYHTTNGGSVRVARVVDSRYACVEVLYDGEFPSLEDAGAFNVPLPFLRHPHEAQLEAKYQALDALARGGVATKSFCLMGTDPEIFVVDAEGTVVPAYDLLPAKDTEDAKKLGLFWDGFLAEMIPPPDCCIMEMTRRVRHSLLVLRDTIKRFNPEFKLTMQNVFRIPDVMRLGAADAHVRLGCDPSLNLYGMHGKFPSSGRALESRFAGGHIHFGYSPKRIEEAVAALDAILGVCAVGLAEGLDNPVRREYYGLAGEFRLPPHGLEYRTLSNFWLLDPMLMNLVFDIARIALKFGEDGYLRMWHAEPKEIIETINGCDVPRARKIVERNEILLRRLLYLRYRGNGHDPDKASKAATAAFQLTQKGAITKFPVDGFMERWDTNKPWPKTFATWMS